MRKTNSKEDKNRFINKVLTPDFNKIQANAKIPKSLIIKKGYEKPKKKF